MALISEGFQEKRLKEYGINIKTKYIVGNKVLERNTDGSLNDDIANGVRCEKQYFVNGIQKHKENNFDTRMEYTFIAKEREGKDYKCPNCGYSATIKDFENGCPYCRTYYNVDYTDKELGSKHHYDLVLLSPIYRVITAAVDLIISIVICYFYIKYTSRTFNGYDISKIYIYGFILALVLYYFFYIVDAYVVLGPIKKYKNIQNQKQIDFWNKTKINKKSFFNNLNYEVRKNYYSKDNIIDYDVIDYISFDEYQKNNIVFVKVKAKVRVVSYENGSIKSKYIDDIYILRENKKEKLVLENDINYIKCPTCGASIDATKGYCEYCRININSMQDWILVK